MSIQLSGNCLPVIISKKFPCTLESLYQISEQSIWFLIWILKKERFWPGLIRETLEEPFTAKRKYWPNGHIGEFWIKKCNNTYHGIYHYWYRNGQLEWERHWKNGKLDGTQRNWYINGQLWSERHWKNGEREGIQHGWYENGQLAYEEHWND